VRYVCGAPGGTTWFQIETQAEAAIESQAMSHAVEKHFIQAQETAAKSYVAPPGPFFERDIGLKAHVQRSMPIFLTLRDAEGATLVTAMLPPVGQDERSFRPVIVGVANSDPSRSTETHQGRREAIWAHARPKPFLTLRSR
jgi:hypothetical protein